jgi:hypothetical protein
MVVNLLTGVTASILDIDDRINSALGEVDVRTPFAGKTMAIPANLKRSL